MSFSLWNDPALPRLLRVAEDNLRALELFSRYLNFNPGAIREQDVLELSDSCELPAEECYRFLLAAQCGLNGEESEADKRMERLYFPYAIRSVSVENCIRDPYNLLIHLPDTRRGNWRMGYKRVEAYEAFASDDLLIMPDGREIPQIGYFTEIFTTPVVYQNEREWMTVTPSEQNTMLSDVKAVSGKVAVFGLGLGYFALLASEKQEVTEVVVVELDEDVIELFRQYLLPQFPHATKIRLVQADAFAYAEAMRQECFDYAYVDIWHDVLDGTEMYLKMKRLERYSPGTKFLYWIEASILCWLRGMALQEVSECQAGPMLNTIGMPEDVKTLTERLCNAELAKMADRIPLSVTRR